MGKRATDQPSEAVSQIHSIVKEADKKYGEGTIAPSSKTPNWLHIPTNIFTLDLALNGGIPRSLITLIYGYTGGGKSTISLKAIGNAQKLLPDHESVFINVEGRYDRVWAQKQGVDTDKLWLVNPPTGEAALDIAEEIINKVDNLSILVLDSLAALTPIAEMERSVEDNLMGVQARLIGKFMRKCTLAINNQRRKDVKPAIILLNQWRSRMVMMGDPRTLPGGIAQNNMASVKIELTCKEHEGKDQFNLNTVDYNEHSFRIAKNSEGVGIRHGEFQMIRNPNHELGEGFINDGHTVCTYGRKMGLITGSGAGGYQIDGIDESFRVLDDMVEYFYNNLEFYNEFKQRLIAIYRANNGLDAETWI